MADTRVENPLEAGRGARRRVAASPELQPAAASLVGGALAGVSSVESLQRAVGVDPRRQQLAPPPD